MQGLLRFRISLLFLLLGILATATTLSAQLRDPDAGKTVAQVEKELMPLAKELLEGDSTDIKIEYNKELMRRLEALLKRPESYNHPFDSLKSISRLRPADESFRIFTWYFVDSNSEAFYAEAAHYHFGLVQRKFVGKNGQIHYLVIPLLELEMLPKGIENIVTDNYSWFGSLYYLPKKQPFLPSYDGFYYKLVPQDGDMKVDDGKKADVVTFVPGRYRERKVTQGEMLNYSTHTRIKQKVRYYLLFGWNGWDNRANYKVVDILTFDPEDSMKVNFGAPVFYFDQIPKARALFKYSEYASFSLNMSWVKSGFFNAGKRRMIMYDHLAPPRNARPTDIFDMGPDGTYDALSWYGRTGGYFEWYRTVQTAEKDGGRRHRKEMEKLQMQYAKTDTLFGDYYEAYKEKNQHRKDQGVNKRAMRRQIKKAEKEIEFNGLDMDKK